MGVENHRIVTSPERLTVIVKPAAVQANKNPKNINT